MNASGILAGAVDRAISGSKQQYSKTSTVPIRDGSCAQSSVRDSNEPKKLRRLPLAQIGKPRHNE
jgi:hypothetical protein